MAAKLIHHFIALALLGAGSGAAGAVRINEMVAATSSRLLQRAETNTFQAGAGTPWQMPSFNDFVWSGSRGPFGFGASFGTNLSSAMLNRAASLYLRSRFVADAAAAASSNSLVLRCDFDDGFVAFLNGAEVARKNMGGSRSFAFRDQAAFNAHPMGTNLALTLGVASNFLVQGTNFLCVQVHNELAGSADFGWSGAMELQDGASTQVLMAATNAAKFWIGFSEPSGGLNVSSSGAVLTVTGREWAYGSFDDTGWQQGPGGFGWGDGDDATIILAEMIGQATTLYMRRSFNVGEALAGSADALKFIVNYDDGYVAYLNGIEISRAGVGLPGEFVPYNATAVSHEAGVPVTNVLGVCSNFLLAGNNVLAIQVLNNSISGDDLSILPSLVAEGATTSVLVVASNTWRYFIAEEAPVPEPDLDAVTSGLDFADWIELYNDATTTVSLAGWSLTDDPETPGLWRFPAGASIPARGYVVVVCNGAPLSNGPPYFSSLKLGEGGEFLSLFDSNGVFVSGSTNDYPGQSYFHSYGWDTGRLANVFFSEPTPGGANAGAVFTNIVDDPEFDLPGGFHTNAITVHLTNATPGSTIRYTLDGSEPRTNTGTVYNPAGFSVTTAQAVRARAFLPGWIPSRTVTRTYLVNLPPALRSLPVVSIVGDAQQALFKSNGVTSIVGGYWTAGVWYASSTEDFNIPVKYGRPYERTISFEFMETGTTGSVYRADCGIRVAGSAYTRPRYVLQSMSGAWYGDATVNKPQFNLFFRSEYGEEPIEFPFIPGSRVDQFEGFRLRGGHNDWNNPFIRDELARRLYYDTGQVSSRGRMANLFVNGLFRCYYNPTERLEERFFREWHRSTNDWDIVNHAGVANGDSVAWNNLVSQSKTLDTSILTNYQKLAALVDPVAFADYIMVNTYAATWDWPGNNFYTARERSSNGTFRFYVWDAEGAFSNTSGKSNSYDTIGVDLLYKTNINIGAIFTGLYKSPEFKLLFADRFHKHVLRGPALTASNVLARTLELKNELDPVMTYVRATTVSIAIITNWAPVRPGYMIQHLRSHGLLPLLSAPVFSTPGGSVTNGFQVSLVNTNGSGQIYYALDGADPRAPGGAIAGTLYTGPVTIDRSRQIRARCLDATNWSPVAEETFLSSQPPIVISEIMFNPESATGAEFVELYNAGSSPVNLADFYFSKGIIFDFAGGAVSNLAPGQYCVVVQNPAFTSRYGTNGILIAGSFGGKLDNSGESLELSHRAFGVIASFDYDNTWFPLTDGQGFSLTMRDPATQTQLLGQKTSWRSSSLFGGTPGGPDGGQVPPPGSVVINEVLTHTDASPDGDWVELLNAGTNAVSIGGWWLSDAAGSPYKYQIPSNALLAPGALAVFSASNHFQNALLAAVPFGLSEFGETVVLSSALDAQGHPTGYSESESFGAQEREVTFGRHVKSTGKSDFVAQRSATRGAANAGPRVGPVVLAEVHFLPATNRVEFLRFYNLAPSNIPLYDATAPTQTWRLANAVAFSFPTGTVAAPYSSFVVSATNPAAFRSLHGLATNYPVFGPFTGALNNAGDHLDLLKALEPDLTNQPYALVESVNYDDEAPWPAMTLTGRSIERVTLAGYGNEPLNWRAGTTNNGSPGPTPTADSDGDGIPDRWENPRGLDALDAVDASGDPDGDRMTSLAEFISGTDPNNPSDYLRLAVTPATNGAPPLVAFDLRPPSGAGYENSDRFYALDSLADVFATNWAPAGAATNIPATNAAPYFLTGTNSSPAFYRARVWLRPK